MMRLGVWERLGAAPGSLGAAPWIDVSGGGTEIPAATGATPRDMPMGACLGMPRGACLMPRERVPGDCTYAW